MLSFGQTTCLQILQAPDSIVQVLILCCPFHLLSCQQSSFFFFFFLEDLKSKLLGIRYNYNIKVYKTEDNARA